MVLRDILRILHRVVLQRIVLVVVLVALPVLLGHAAAARRDASRSNRSRADNLTRHRLDARKCLKQWLCHCKSPSLRLDTVLASRMSCTLPRLQTDELAWVAELGDAERAALALPAATAAAGAALAAAGARSGRRSRGDLGATEVRRDGHGRAHLTTQYWSTPRRSFCRLHDETTASAPEDRMPSSFLAPARSTRGNIEVPAEAR